MNAKLRIVAAGIAAAILLSGCASGASTGATVEEGKLTTCADIPYPPFEIEDPSSPTGYSGFDIEIIGAIADKMGLELVVKDVDFTALESATVLVAGECDLGTSALTITEARKANIDFADPYYDSLQSLLVKKDSGITSLADMAGKTLGVQNETTGASYANANAPADTSITNFPDDGTLWPALTAGQIDGILQDQPVNHEHEVADPNYVIVEEYDTQEQYGFAFAKDKNPELLAEINKQLKAIRDDGTYDAIYAKYFGAK
jgi:polar amino acid transport system substrate-binding protein